jgi:hypothetical protein
VRTIVQSRDKDDEESITEVGRKLIALTGRIVPERTTVDRRAMRASAQACVYRTALSDYPNPADVEVRPTGPHRSDPDEAYGYSGDTLGIIYPSSNFMHR